MAVEQVPVSSVAVAPRRLWLARAPWYYGWTIVGVCAAALAIAMGARAVVGVILAALFEAFDWGRGATAGALSISFVVSTVTAPGWGALLDRWGHGRVLAAAALIGGAGLAVAAAAQELWQLYLGL